MAECIPDHLSSRASRGEERTFALLKKLPDDYLIYHEANIDNRQKPVRQKGVKGGTVPMTRLRTGGSFHIGLGGGGHRAWNHRAL
jgi:hypothetical protein